MQKHTPGPWEAKPFSNHSATTVMAGKDPIAECSGFGKLNDDCLADARLIAAAPELLAALIECHEAMTYMSEYDIPLCLPDHVSAAIAKATGSAQ